VIRIERAELRDEPTAIDAEQRPPRPLAALLRCRAGIEEILAQELAPALAPRVAGRGRVEAVLDGPLALLRRPRTALRFALPLPPEPIAGDEDLAEAAARALTGATALSILRAFTVGTIRYRLEWEGAGHRRALTYRCARLVSERCAELLNDPTRSPWQVSLSEEGGGGRRRVRCELEPRGLADERFAYRVRDLPAASHPTLAAALARVGEARDDDVVLDPFVGSGLELVERGLLGPYAQLVGCDVSATAIAAARANLEAAGLRRFVLLVGDLRQLEPRRRPTLVITNPPMGRRLPTPDLDALLEAAVQRAAALLVPGGRMVWLSPRFGRSVAAAARAGLRPELRRRVDMGGFDAELQRFVKPRAG
jgi:23S rRNA G2445 N2-methylase RlmL